MSAPSLRTRLTAGASKLPLFCSNDMTMDVRSLRGFPSFRFGPLRFVDWGLVEVAF